MGLCESRQGGSYAALERPKSTILTLYGDHFSPDTRSILILIKMGAGDALPFNFHMVDQFSGAHNRDEFLKVNPLGTLPTVIEGRHIVLGSFIVFVQYLMSKNERIKDKLYP